MIRRTPIVRRVSLMLVMVMLQSLKICCLGAFAKVQSRSRSQELNNFAKVLEIERNPSMLLILLRGLKIFEETNRSRIIPTSAKFSPRNNPNVPTFYIMKPNSTQWPPSLQRIAIFAFNLNSTSSRTMWINSWRNRF